MPILAIETNLRRDQIPKDFLSVAGKAVAAVLGKPAEYVAVNVSPDHLIEFAGTEEPFAVVSLSSIGEVGGEKNKTIVPVLSQLVVNNLGIKQDRFYVLINGLEAPNVGYNGNALG